MQINEPVKMCSFIYLFIFVGERAFEYRYTNKHILRNKSHGSIQYFNENGRRTGPITYMAKTSGKQSALSIIMEATTSKIQR